MLKPFYYTAMFSLNVLMAAWTKVRLKSRIAGIDGITLDLFAANLNERLQHLQTLLNQEAYFASPALGFYRPKKSGGKRLIGIHTVSDRLVQRLLLEEIYYSLEEIFLDCSYAYRPDRNIQQAVAHFSHHYQYHPSWVIKADIESFFDNLCWALLLTEIENISLNSELFTLLSQQLKTGIILNGQYVNFGKGVIQGSLLSGTLANLYLNNFDRQCLSQGINLVRYGDDFVIACPSLLAAEKTIKKIEFWLKEIYLNLQESKTKIYAPDEEFSFLGYQFVKGNIYAPPPPNTQGGGGSASESGLSYQRKNRTLQFISRPPKGDKVANSKYPITSRPEHYWSEPMTTLYITEQGSFLKVQNQQFQIFCQQELRCKIPVNRVTHMVIFGCCNISHGAIGLALSKRIPVMFLSQRGRYFGRLQTEGYAKVEYLERQVICSTKAEFIRQQAEIIVLAKLHNSRALLLKLNRRHSTKEAEAAIESLASLMTKLVNAESMDALRGYEGKAAVVYFQGLSSLLANPFTFEKRTKRPPKDPVNSLLSLGYTLLSQNVFSFVQTMGLHTHFGNLHVPRDNHPALVSDLMEEFRAQFVDSFVAYLVNSKIFTLDDFTSPDAQGGVYLYPNSLKKFLKHWEDKLQTEITHPHTGYKVTYRRCIELQVREYISCLLGDVEAYRPMCWKL